MSSEMVFFSSSSRSMRSMIALSCALFADMSAPPSYVLDVPQRKVRFLAGPPQFNDCSERAPRAPLLRQRQPLAKRDHADLAGPTIQVLCDLRRGPRWVLSVNLDHLLLSDHRRGLAA